MSSADLTRQMMDGWYAYNAVGEVYHTDPSCPSVTAFDTLTRVAPTKSDLPDHVTRHCGQCERVGGVRR